MPLCSWPAPTSVPDRHGSMPRGPSRIGDSGRSSPSFADIFRGNCQKIGLLPIELAEGEIDRLMTIASGTDNWVTIDLEKQTVVTGDLVASFDIDPFVKHCLLNGLDQIALSMQHGEVIADFEAARPTYRPSLR